MAIRKRTNTFRLVVEDGTLSGNLQRNGDLRLYLNGHWFTTIPGHLIPALAHWLTGVNGRYADIDPSKLQAHSPVLPLFGTPKRTE